MNEDTKEALLQSIEHWKENEKVLEYDFRLISYKKCALCRLFIENRCIGCPVFEKTGHNYCEHTPYYKVSRIHDLWSRNKYSEQLSNEFRAAAKEEREFLESLLPKGE